MASRSDTVVVSVSVCSAPLVALIAIRPDAVVVWTILGSCGVRGENGYCCIQPRELANAAHVLPQRDASPIELERFKLLRRDNASVGSNEPVKVGKRCRSKAVIEVARIHPRSIPPVLLSHAHQPAPDRDDRRSRAARILARCPCPRTKETEMRRLWAVLVTEGTATSVRAGGVSRRNYVRSERPTDGDGFSQAARSRRSRSSTSIIGAWVEPAYGSSPPKSARFPWPRNSG